MLDYYDWSESITRNNLILCCSIDFLSMVCRDALSRQSYTLWFQRCSLSHDYVSPLLSSNEYYLLYCTLLHSGSGLALCPWLWFMVGNWIRKCQLHLLSMSCIQCVRRDRLFGLLWGYAPTKQSAEIDGENRKRSTSSKVSIEEESNIAQDIELYILWHSRRIASNYDVHRRNVLGGGKSHVEKSDVYFLL